MMMIIMGNCNDYSPTLLSGKPKNLPCLLVGGAPTTIRAFLARMVVGSPPTSSRSKANFLACQIATWTSNRCSCPWSSWCSCCCHNNNNKKTTHIWHMWHNKYMLTITITATTSMFKFYFHHLLLHLLGLNSKNWVPS